MGDDVGRDDIGTGRSHPQKHNRQAKPLQQRQRFLSRLNEPEKHWKFSDKDVKERQHWDRYMRSYEDAIQQTSRPWAPWYAIPADDKPYMRATVAEIIVRSLEQVEPGYPTVDAEKKRNFKSLSAKLDVESFRDGKQHRQTYSRGKATMRRHGELFRIDAHLSE